MWIVSLCFVMPTLKLKPIWTWTLKEQMCGFWMQILWLQISLHTSNFNKRVNCSEFVSCSHERLFTHLADHQHSQNTEALLVFLLLMYCNPTGAEEQYLYSNKYKMFCLEVINEQMPSLLNLSHWSSVVKVFDLKPLAALCFRCFFPTY